MIKKEFTYEGAGFPVKLIGFPFKTIAGEEVPDFDLNKLDLFIARAVLLKPALLSGKEIRFLRILTRQTLAAFGNILDVAASTIKNWEDDHSKIDYRTDFSIRNTIAEKLHIQDAVSPVFVYHSSLLKSADLRESDNEITIPFNKLREYQPAVSMA